MFYHVRVTIELIEWMKTWVSKVSLKYIITEEIGEKEEGLHYHILFDYDKKESNIRKAINAKLSELGLKGQRGKENKYYGALKEWVGDDFSYVVKDGKIVESREYTPEEIEVARQKGAADKVRVTALRAAASSKAKAIADKKSYVEDLVVECVDAIKESKNSDNYYDATQMAVKFFLKAYKGRIDDFRLFPLVRSALYQLGGISQNMIEQQTYHSMLSKLGSYRGTQMCVSETGLISSDLISHE